jgi:hypothetical protein
MSLSLHTQISEKIRESIDLKDVKKWSSGTKSARGDGWDKINHYPTAADGRRN